jgi:hypothetical protein
MNARITWKLFLDVSSAAKAAKITKRFAETIGLDVRTSEPETYVKGRARYKVLARAEMNENSPGDALFKIMQVSSRLAGAWSVAGPNDGDGTWEVSGSANPGTLRIQGIDSAEFDAEFGDYIEACKRRGERGEGVG